MCLSGVLQGLDTRDPTTLPAPTSPTELPEEFDVRGLRVGIPKVGGLFCWELYFSTQRPPRPHCSPHRSPPSLPLEVAGRELVTMCDVTRLSVP